MTGILTKIREMDDAAALAAAVADFYAAAYAFYRANRSVPAYFRLSQDLLQTVCRVGLRRCRTELGEGASELPPLALLAIGTAGRGEYSPSCRLKLMVIHSETGPAGKRAILRLGEGLHQFLATAGLWPDAAIATCNPAWVGTAAGWQERFERCRKTPDAAEQIELIRLADLAVLHDEAGMGAAFRETALELIHRDREMIQGLIRRLRALPSATGILGGLRLERRGRHKHLFRLLEMAIIPFSMSITALSLLREITAVETPRRIRDLLAGGHLNVGLAEHLLETWHLINGLRLTLESGAEQPSHEQPLFLDYDLLSGQEQEALQSAVDTVADLQRHLYISVSDWEG